jgi:hypothetical protein
MDDHHQWVSIARVQGDLQAELLRGLLEAQEIPVLLSREGAGRAIGLTIGLLGEVEIMVPDKYKDEAISILDLYEKGAFEDQGDEDIQGNELTNQSNGST